MPYARRSRFRSRRPRRRSFPARYRFGKNRMNRYSRYRKTNRPARWFSRKYNFKERFESNVFQMLYAGTTTGNAFTCQAVTFPAWIHRKPLADQYKIYKWKILITPQAMSPAPPSSDLAAGGAFSYAGLIQHALVPDYTDNNTPTSWQSMLDNPLCRRTTGFRPLKMIIRPRLLKAAYETGVNTAYMPSMGWVSTNDDVTPHYGFKWMANAQNCHFEEPIIFKVTHTVYYGLKNTQATV